MGKSCTRPSPSRSLIPMWTPPRRPPACRRRCVAVTVRASPASPSRCRQRNMGIPQLSQMKAPSRQWTIPRANFRQAWVRWWVSASGPRPFGAATNLTALIALIALVAMAAEQATQHSANAAQAAEFFLYLLLDLLAQVVNQSTGSLLHLRSELLAARDFAGQLLNALVNLTRDRLFGTTHHALIPRWLRWLARRLSRLRFWWRLPALIGGILSLTALP